MGSLGDSALFYHFSNTADFVRLFYLHNLLHLLYPHTCIHPYAHTCIHPHARTCTCPQDRCNALFKQVHEEKHLKGRANDAVAAACLYIACRQEEVPRSFKEICAVSRHPKKEIGKCFKLITRQSNPILPGLVNTSDFMVWKLPLASHMDG